MNQKLGKICLIISGLLIISTLTACSSSTPTKTNVEKLNYIEISKDIKDKVNSYWQQQELDFRSEMEWGRKKKEMIAEREVSWQKNFQKIELPFPSSKEQELDRLLTGLKHKLTADEVKIELETESSGSEVAEAELTVKLQSAELKDKELTLYHLKMTQPKVKARMAFIIDDLGFNRDGTAELMEIDRPLTVAVLPFRPYSTSDAEKAVQAGHEILLHLPMEPSSPVSPGEGAIYTDMAPEEIRTTIQKGLASLGVEVAGVNNHMGSKVTADNKTMSVVLDYLHQQDLFFIDSSTAPRSVVPAAAREVGESYAVNHLFIDNIDDKERINKQIQYLADVALKQGELITIGHIKPNTIQAIKELIPKLEEKGIQLVYVSELVK
ncbi:divergent polysaccharide deacetylase family protein [Acetohalobium arabaticum]|uniref:Divergent polysaccharide deacetylase family protein n=1 Tax=Acetohalobium arabaticum (strain ATCC 49924 / DSM 5501 / Z-7288) TaxID=574087 RepID=D9QU42_ACEAZ|nr:divergent polysaccharide deacetylase family protein [Acetohalobium arabaticum]ADL11835.1 protein of unknown function DUF610 YibQ [Acetohalobium arabaticum DSM 5501]